MTSDVNSDILDCILATGVVIFENRSNIGVIFDSTTFIFLPKGMIVFGHDGCLCDDGRDDCRDIPPIRGSAIKTAFAGTVLGMANVPGTVDENTPNVTAPFIPDTSDAICADNTGF